MAETTKLALGAIALLRFVVSSASARDVRYDFDKSKDFSQYKTYKRALIEEADQPDEFTATRLASAVDAQLAMKGLSKIDPDPAVLYADFQTALGTESNFHRLVASGVLARAGKRGGICRRDVVLDHLWFHINGLCRPTGPEHLWFQG
jgi:hypothetical protein